MKIEEVPELASITSELKKKFSSLLILVCQSAKGVDVCDLKKNWSTLIQHHNYKHTGQNYLTF